MYDEHIRCLEGDRNQLHRASRQGDGRRVSDLLKSGEQQVNQTCCKEGWTSLMHASHGGHSGIAGLLFRSGAALDAVSGDGATALHISVRNGHIDAAILLLQAGAESNREDARGYTPLMLLCEGLHGGLELMEGLISAGANVDHALLDGTTPLYLVSAAGRADEVKMLLDSGANPRLRTVYGYTPLDAAATQGHLQAVRENISFFNMQDPDVLVDVARALQLAAQSGHIGVMDALCSAGAKDNEGDALCAAVSHGGEIAVKFLLGCRGVYQPENPGSPVYANYARRQDGVSPLLCCLMSVWPSASVKILRRLIDAGSSTTATFVGKRGDEYVLYTPLEILQSRLDDESPKENDLKTNVIGMQRLLLQENAVHALSWGWPGKTNEENGAASPTAKAKALTAVRIWGRGSRRGAPTTSRVFLRAALIRYINKEDGPHDSEGKEKAAHHLPEEQLARNIAEAVARTKARIEKEDDREAEAVAKMVEKLMKRQG